MEDSKKASPKQVQQLQEQVKFVFARMKLDEFSPFTRLINLRLERLLDTLKKSDDISNIRFVQGQISVYEWLINNINS